MEQATSTMFDIPKIPDIQVHGRTDSGIFEELFELIGQDYQQHRTEFMRRYYDHLPSTLQTSNGYILPGVEPLLNRLTSTPEIQLGLLTGNTRRAAELKLNHFGLDSFFQFGGYGDHHCCRNEVARLARQAAQDYLGDRFKPDKLWVVGDTVNDIRCARAVEARVIAVETGGGNRSELESADPDQQLETLVQTDTFLNFLNLSDTSPNSA